MITTITLPEGLVIMLLGGIGVVLWWGVRRLVDSQDDTGHAIIALNTILSAMNARLAASEMWMDMHEKTDNDRHRQTEAAHEALWRKVSHQH